jgi:hypothetical protein
MVSHGVPRHNDGSSCSTLGQRWALLPQVDRRLLCGNDCYWEATDFYAVGVG